MHPALRRPLHRDLFLEATIPLAIQSLAFCLLASTMVCTLLAVIYLTRADLRTNLSDAELDTSGRGRWWALLPYGEMIPPSELLSPTGRRLRRTGLRWALAAAGSFLALVALMVLVRRVIG